ncbi:MAG: cyclic pyranopterin monophosphate synthase MoaC [Rhodospirillaceae bacterium]|nr:cyclic pyranopterin monophosphate synthase MoaC [Rhodospirillaceae bacterium]|tara:strand:+ start:361 stop:843 length:483 start_codon:yes stop_codon:yes gene_type:complete
MADNKFTHIDANGNARMVDVSDKEVTRRTATAGCRVVMQPETIALIRDGAVKKGDVVSVARLAGIMGAKKTSELIPLCHPLLINKADVEISIDDGRNAVVIEATVRVDGKTGVEMEALTAASVAALTVYDMVKAVDRGTQITDMRLLRKAGGKSGSYEAK